MALSTDHSADVLSLLAPEVVYTVPGHGPMAGVFRGPEQVQEHITDLFRLTSGTFEVLKWVDWLLGLSHVAALQFVQAQGDSLIFRAHVVYLVETDRDDLITSIRILFEDESDADTFFSTLRHE